MSDQHTTESAQIAQRLLETFAAYKDAERKADEAYLNYKLGRVADHVVHAAQRVTAKAQAAHLAVIEEVRHA